MATRYVTKLDAIKIPNNLSLCALPNFEGMWDQVNLTKKMSKYAKTMKILYSICLVKWIPQQPVIE